MKTKQDFLNSKEYSESFLENVFTLTQKYNNAQVEALQDVTKTYNPNMYKNEVIERETKAAKEKVINEYFCKATEELGKCLQSEKYRAEDIYKVKYPDASGETSSTLKSERVAGELQINSALQFLAINKDPQTIINAANNALSSNRIDFASALFDSVLAGKPESLEAAASLSDAQQNLFRIIENRVKEYNENTGLNYLHQAQANYKKAASEIGAFLNALRDGAVSFYPRDMVKRMQVQEINDKIDDINKSCSYYK